MVRQPYHSPAQVNLSSPGSTAPVDHWHNDSVAFAGVVVLSDMEVNFNLLFGQVLIYQGMEAGFIKGAECEMTFIYFLIFFSSILGNGRREA